MRIKSTHERRYSALKCSWEASHVVSIPGWLTPPIGAPRSNRDTHSVHSSLQRGCRFSNSTLILGSQQIVLNIFTCHQPFPKMSALKKQNKQTNKIQHKMPSNQKNMRKRKFYHKKNDASFNTRAVSLGHSLWDNSLLTTYYYQFKLPFYISKYICKTM